MQAADIAAFGPAPLPDGCGCEYPGDRAAVDAYVLDNVTGLRAFVGNLSFCHSPDEQQRLLNPPETSVSWWTVWFKSGMVARLVQAGAQGHAGQPRIRPARLHRYASPSPPLPPTTPFLPPLLSHHFPPRIIQLACSFTQHGHRNVTLTRSCGPRADSPILRSPVVRRPAELRRRPVRGPPLLRPAARRGPGRGRIAAGIPAPPGRLHLGFGGGAGPHNTDYLQNDDSYHLGLRCNALHEIKWP